MTDISVIKMILSVAIWRIYPSWVNDKLWAWEGLGHSGMFWARLSRDDFLSKLEIISFPSRVMSVSKSFFFVSCAFEWFGAKCSSSGAFGFGNVLGLFLKTPLRHRAFFTNSYYDHKYFLEIPFFLKSRGGFTCLTAMAIPSLSKALWWWYVENQNETRLPGVGEIERSRTIDRRRDWYKSCAMIHGPEERKKTQGNQRVIRTIYKPASFEEPVSEARRRYRFALRYFHGRGCTAAGRSGCSAGTAKKSSHPWHFRCWSLRRNELECTDLIHWTEALHRFSSRDAIMDVGSVLEKHFDGDFSPRSLSNVGHRCTKAENLAWHSTRTEASKPHACVEWSIKPREISFSW